MFKKIIFPFFNKDRHEFLSKKWRFRLLMSIYIFVLIFFPVREAFKEYSDTTDTCYDYVYEYNYYQSYSECMKSYGYYGWWTTLFYFWINLLFMIIIHYAFQLIFFKRFVNYIILGGKKNFSKK